MARREETSFVAAGLIALGLVTDCSRDERVSAPVATGGALGFGGAIRGGRYTGGEEPIGGWTTGGSGGLAGKAGGGAGGVAGRAPTAGTAGVPGGCRRNGDCSSGQVCGERRADGQFYCTSAATGGETLGAVCTGGLTTTECVDRVCLVGVSSRCSRLCVDDQDCAGASGYVCIEIGAARFCVQRCQVPTDCTEDQACTLGANPGADRWDFVCELSHGPIAAGGDCTLVNRCASGLCLYGANGLDTCSSPCTTSADCPAALPMCGAVNVESPSSHTGQPVSACVAAEG